MNGKEVVDDVAEFDAPARRVSAIIPAYNEADRVAATVYAAARIPGVYEVIVIDDGSIDSTAQVARAAGARVIRLPCNRGKGAALTAGANAASGPVLLLLDADLGETASDADALVRPVLAGCADVTVGLLPPPALGAAGLGIVVRLARWAIQLRTGRVVQAPLSGQRCLNRAAFDRCCPLADRFGVEVGMTIDALSAQLRVLEIPVQLSHRATGRGAAGWLHRASQGADVLRAVASRVLRAPVAVRGEYSQ